MNRRLRSLAWHSHLITKQKFSLHLLHIEQYLSFAAFLRLCVKVSWSIFDGYHILIYKIVVLHWVHNNEHWIHGGDKYVETIKYWTITSRINQIDLVLYISNNLVTSQIYGTFCLTRHLIHVVFAIYKGIPNLYNSRLEHTVGPSGDYHLNLQRSEQNGRYLQTTLSNAWASCQIRKLWVAHAQGMPGTFSRHRLQVPPK